MRKEFPKGRQIRVGSLYRLERAWLFSQWQRIFAGRDLLFSWSAVLIVCCSHESAPLGEASQSANSARAPERAHLQALCFDAFPESGGGGVKRVNWFTSGFFGSRCCWPFVSFIPGLGIL